MERRNSTPRRTRHATTRSARFTPKSVISAPTFWYLPPLNLYSMSLPRDISEFLEGYPDVPDDPEVQANLEFYTNTRRCRPDGMLIDEIHDEWFGDYDLLERKHGYIQWLFPIREYGMNFQSQPLQRHEIESMKSNPSIIKRVLASYKLMLDFYGMRLLSKENGLLERSLPPRNYASRYRNLLRSPHNNLRISRILKCLSELGLEHLNLGFILFVLSEQSESRELDSGTIRSSMDRWWANCVRKQADREWIGRLIRKIRSDQGDFVFTREDYKTTVEARMGSGRFLPTT